MFERGSGVWVHTLLVHVKGQYFGRAFVLALKVCFDLLDNGRIVWPAKRLCMLRRGMFRCCFLGEGRGSVGLTDIRNFIVWKL
jgi:hypothetical protein